VLISLPLACLGAFIGLYFTHETINAMTLGGLALAIGLLIDQSIVVIENTERHLAMGKSPLDAARDGATEVAKPLLIITLTLGVVFFPIIFITGIGKFLFTPLAKTVIMALGTSYMLALTLVPVCAAQFLKSRGSRRKEAHSSKSEIRNPKSESDQSLLTSAATEHEERGWFHRLCNRYQNWLRRALGVRWLVLGATAAVFALSLVLFKNLGTELFPQTDVSQFTVKVRAPTGLRIERTPFNRPSLIRNAKSSSRTSACCSIGPPLTRQTPGRRTPSFSCNSRRSTASPRSITCTNSVKNCRVSSPASSSASTPAG
jgi:multidrug efflux pump subunit AcrB